jgi:hypothetical protein
MTGRNDPCPCGSGKKFKKCHGAESPPAMGATYNNLRRLEGLASTFLMEYAAKRFGEGCLEDAWEQFCDAEQAPYDPNDPQYSYFLRWVEYDWQPEETETLAALYLSDSRSKVDPEIRRVIEATMAAPYSFYQVVDTDPGASLSLRDVLRRKDVQVTERTASETLEKGHIIFARVVELDGLALLMGIGTQPLRAVFLSEILEVRREFDEAGRLDREPEGTEILLESELDFRDLYFSLIGDMIDMMTQIRNTDGDPLVLHKLRYSITGFEPAFLALKTLDQKAGYIVDATTTADGEVGEDGAQVRGRILWMKRKRGVKGESSVIATLTFTDTTLFVEINSEKRSTLIQKEIGHRLGKRATLMHLDITPAAGMMKQALEALPARDPKAGSREDRRFKESPEVQEIIKRKTEEHWKTWPDIPVPALRGLTPRQAAKDEEGRELLESLLLEFEATSGRKKNASERVDVAKLRRELGLEKPG